jgi:hypothetical protein
MNTFVPFFQKLLDPPIDWFLSECCFVDNKVGAGMG